MKVLSPVLYHDEAHEATQHIDEISQRMGSLGPLQARGIPTVPVWAP